MSQSAKTLSAGVVPVRCREGRWCFLLLRAYGYWDFPKGEVEAGERPLEAALREVKEETGLEHPVLRWDERYCETSPYGHGKVARYYLAESDTGEVVLGTNPELGRPEHHEFRWLPYNEARSLLVPRVQVVLDWANAIVGERCG